MKAHDTENHADLLGCGQLSPELEVQFLDALSGLPSSEALQAHMHHCPLCATEVAELSELAHVMEADTASTHPGPHFFEAFHSEIMGKLGPQGTEQQYGDISELEVSPAPKRPSWFESAWAFLTQHPTLGIGAVVAAAALALVFLWPSNTLVMPTPNDDNSVVAEHELDKAEIEGIAEEVDINLEEEDAYAWDDEQDDASEEAYWAAGASANLGSLSEQEFDAVLAELRESL